MPKNAAKRLFFYRIIRTALILFAVVVNGICKTVAQDVHSRENVEVIVEKTPHSLTFSLDDTEAYSIQDLSCKSVKSFEEGEVKEYTCDNLDACSTYKVIVSIKNLEDGNIFESTIDEKTDYIAPETKIGEIETTIDAINLTWTTSDISCVSEFVIEVKSVDKEFKWTVAKDKNQLNIDGLSPCQEYNVQLKTYNIYNEFISNLTNISSTDYAEPGNVTVIVEPYNDNMRVFWQPPQYKTCINYYYIEWTIVGCVKTTNIRLRLVPFAVKDTELFEYDNTSSAKGACESSDYLWDSSSTYYDIPDLQGCENYEIRIYINNESNAKCDPVKFSAPEQIPGPVTNQLSEINSTNVTISWTEPTSNIKCINFYRVIITGPIQRPIEDQKIKSNEIKNTEVFFDELDPCGKYNVTIWTVSLNGTAGPKVIFDFTTLEAKPTAIQNNRVEQKPHALDIYWDPPAFADLCLNGYRLTGWNDENVPDPAFEKVTNDTFARFEELLSCQSYTIQIIPQTISNMDGELKHIETETDAKVADAPSTFDAIGLHPDSLELNAKDLSTDNKCEIIFARFVCELTKAIDSAERYIEEGQVGGISFNALLSPLSPYTDYKCAVAFYNIAGWSANKTLLKKTEPYFPDPPDLVSLKSSTNTTLNIGWQEPKYPNGKINLYIYHFQYVKANYYTPPSCSSIVRDPITRQTSSLEQSFPTLLPYTVYSIQIAAENDYGIGEYTKPFMAITDPSMPGSVTNLNVIIEGPYGSEEEYKANVIISWIVPCRSNGEIESFELDFIGKRQNYHSEHFHRSVEPHFNTEGRMIHNETNLKPEYSYTVSVSVKTKNFTQTSSETKEEFLAPAGIPRKLSEDLVRETRADVFDADNPTHSAVVYFPDSILTSDSGTIFFVALLLSEKICNPQPHLKYGALDSSSDWPNVASWNDVYVGDSCITQYQTTPLRWYPILTEAEHQVKYEIGIENCESSNNQSYCNGPLKTDTEYNLVLRLFTNSGYNDVAVIEFKTESLIQLTLILLSVCTCLLLAFIAGLVYIGVTQRLQSKRQSCHGIEDLFGDVTAKSFAIYYREISKPEKIAREFKELTMVAMDLSTSASEIGTKKNRYTDIFPYDKNRVILDIDADGSDYINASFIDGYRRKKEYIATQGPKPESTLDFWRMILQHNVRAIVMVTQFREGNTVKCHEYFPFKSKEITVSLKKKDAFELYDRSEITVKNDKYGLKQKIVHFYFKKWNDHDCPSDPMHLITFVRKVKAEKMPKYSPVVVHCSAGVGRTGTYIGLDILMQRLKSESKVNIYETVKKLRFQRMKMVQTLAQYKFLYACTYELVKHKNNNARTVLKYEKNAQKKVSFQDGLVVNSDKIYNVRRVGSTSDLSIIAENVNKNASDQSGRQVDAFNVEVKNDLSTFLGLPLSENHI